MESKLYAEEQGNSENSTIIFLHGLLGSSRNWRSVTKSFSEKYHTICFDLPNHGKSLHEEESTVQKMAKSIHAELVQRGVSQFSLCGHSLGGKVAMKMACDYSQRIKKLLVVDIAPRDYPADHHLPTLMALADLDLIGFTKRKEVDEALAEKIPNWAFRQFLLTNLGSIEGRFAWIPNLNGLISSIKSLSSNPLNQNDLFEGPSLFLRGGKSGYVRSEHFDEIKRYFPTAEIKTLTEAGHDLHVEDRKGFVAIFRKFLEV